MILITTPTGRTGSQLTKQLIDNGQKLRLFARHPEKLEALKDEAEIFQGSLLNEAQFTKALQGCNALYFCIPETHIHTDVVKYYEDYAHVAANAIKNSDVKRVVFVSGGGKGGDSKSGFSYALHRAEDILAATGVSFMALRCPVFFDSMLWQADTIKETGMFFFPFDGNYKAPQVASKDISSAACHWLTDTTWSGVKSQAIHGPADICYNDIAQILSETLSRTVRFQPVPRQGYIETLLAIGGTQAFADALVDMYDAIQQDLFKAEPRTAETTTATSFAQWAKDVFLPAYQRI